MSDEITASNGEYEAFLRDLKDRIRSAQVRAALAVSRELILLYWQIGRDIMTRQEEHGWGNNVIDRIAKDLKSTFPNVEGFSRRSLYRMRAFYLTYRDNPEFVSQVATQIPWFHNVVLIEKVKEENERLWYAQKTLEHGWSRAVLEAQIETGLYHRQGKAITNFERTLPPVQSDLARQLLKDPYDFDVRHDTRYDIPDSVRGILGRMYPSQPAYL
jgi:predicted nuclease of restriction endonuclease-like (RecB) superfamily